MTDFFDLETRKKIFKIIEQHPGLNLTTLAEMLQISIPLVDYHTKYFEEHELITIVKEEGFKRYYVKGSIGSFEQKLFHVLRQEIPLKIVLFLLKNPYARHTDILAVIHVSKSTLSYHLQKLVRKGIVRVAGEDITYVVVNEKQVILFLIQYKPSRVLKRFAETWEDFGVR